MYKVGILRVPSLNPYEAQCFEKLPKFGFQPIGIATYENLNWSEIHFPIRVGHNFKTLTKGKIRPLMLFVGKATKYNVESLNLRIFDLNRLTKDLDVIYSNDMWYPYTYQAVKTGIPTIVQEWENIPYNVTDYPYSKIKKYNRKNAKHFVAVTQKAKEALILEGVDSNKISVVPAGIDCEKFKPAEKDDHVAQKLGISQNATKVLFVGRLVPEKGVFDLVEAFAKLQKKITNIELLVVGSGSSNMLLQIKTLIKNLNVEAKVKLLGNIAYADMPRIHNQADVFCLPSFQTKAWAEQFGYSMVEAMACGKPVVSTVSGSIPEIVAHRRTGILVGPHSPKEIESALEELIVNKNERIDFGRNAREWVLEQFEANKTASKLGDIFRKFV